MPEVHAYIKKIECVFETTTPPAGENVTVVALVAETQTECREESCFAHSTCSISSAEAAPLGLLERQNWLVGCEMNKLACLGSLQSLRDHLALACNGFWQMRYAKMSLHVAAAVAAARGHSELVLYLCKERGVAVNLIAYPILHEAGTALVSAVRHVHEDRALQLMALPDQDLKLHMGKWKETLLHLATRHGASRVVKKLLDTCGALLEVVDERGFNAVSLAASYCRVFALRVLLQEYQARGRLEEALERSRVGSTGAHRPLLFLCLSDFQVEEAMRLAATRLLVEEFNANNQTTCRQPSYEISPINLAVGKGLLSIVKFYVLECGVPVNGPSAELTTLHSAVTGELEEEDKHALDGGVAYRTRGKLEYAQQPRG